ncbi:hypothetical protein OGAPHI_003914 [Ogataea philodendri]|uniref:Uncharacterized protein n=1 Tax=Ogataea philodendri TaxID=1378263 RepID=A0A9P8P619_9ASCO|nr:uncharacterized protein OGAPHI_003914 [Ogataea philodendri]KAH3665726.1 hypothetical protein OGAPHI_003914 [Ogataea philodendri]
MLVALVSQGNGRIQVHFLHGKITKLFSWVQRYITFCTALAAPKDSHHVRVQAVWAEDEVWFAVRKVQDSLAKLAVAPAEPRPRVVVSGRVDVDALVHEAQSGRGGLDKVQQLADLLVVVGGTNLQQQRHRPRVRKSNVRAPNALEVGPLEVVRVAVFGQDHATGVLVNLVVLVDKAHVWQRQQRRDVCIVHDVHTAKTIHLIREHFAERLVVHHAVLADSFANGGGRLRSLVRKTGKTQLAQHGLHQAEFDLHLRVGRDK